MSDGQSRRRPVADRDPASRYVGLTHLTAALALLTALWLVISPWVLGETRASAPTWDQVAVGGLLALVAALRLAAPLRFEALWWAEFVLGLWTICAGLLLGYPVGFDRLPMMWNHILTGAVVLSVAGYSAALRDSHLAEPRQVG